MVDQDNIIERSLNRKSEVPSCPFDNEGMVLAESTLRDGTEADVRAEIQVWKCPTCGFLADFIEELSAEEFGAEYRGRGNKKRIEIKKDKFDRKVKELNKVNAP